MSTMNDDEAAQVTGGIYPGDPVERLYMAYTGLLHDMETRPQKYTWLLDWYYGG
ncbi:MAG TPA: hypothetical protein VG734_14950 [Lacunisphaera sp.]|nr:hypothetical protein [Lacunisphaera sp.]